MKRSKWLIGALFLVLALGLLLAACGEEAAETTTTAPPTTAPPGTAPPGTAAPTTAPAAERETLRIGVLLQLTDWYSAVDAAEKTDVELVAKMINEDGGIKVQGKTYNVELVIEDGRSSLDGNTAAAHKLVLDHKVKFVIGPGAFFNVATSPIFTQAEVLHVANYNGLMPGELGPETPFGFLGLDPIAQQNVNLKAIQTLYPDVKTITMATEDATYPAFEPHFMALVERMGVTLAGDPVLFATAAEDYNPIATKIMGQNPDAVWIPIVIPPSAGAIVKGLRTLGYEGPIAWSAHGPTTIGLAGPEASTNLIQTLGGYYKAPGNTPVLDRILGMGDTNRQWFGMSPNGLYMLKHAIEAADSLDPAVVRDTWQNMDTIPTVYGDGFPSANELYGVTNRSWAYPCSVNLIMDGKLEHKGWIVPDPTP